MKIEMDIVSPQEVYDFWFNEDNEQFWFDQNDQFDKEIRDRFYETWDAGRQGLLYEWRETLTGAMAEIIVLDQFSRNLNRGTYLSYSQDQMALVLSQNLMQRYPEHRNLSVDERSFIYIPWMHSESEEIHKITEKLYLELDSKRHTQSMIDHKAIIDQFGRYPYRNKVLGRNSTEEELEFILSTDLGFTKI